MRAGKLSHRLTYQTSVVSKDTTGADTLSWVDQFSLAASVKVQENLREIQSGGELVVRKIIDVELRYRPDIREDGRFRWDSNGSRILNILRVADTGPHSGSSRVRNLMLICEEDRSSVPAA